MQKENVLFGVIGLLAGLIIGFMATNYLNRTGYVPTAATAPTAPATAGNQGLPHPPIAGGAGQPQINQQVVRDQTQTGGMLPQVQETIDKATKEPNNFEAQMTAGDMYYRIRSFEKAAPFFEKAVALKPDSVDALVKAGNAYYDAAATVMEAGSDGTPNFKNAEKFYTQVLAKTPNDVNVRTDLGLTFYYRVPKDLDRAIAEYQKSLQANPSHELTLQNLSVAYREKGDKAALQTTLDKLRSINPNNPALTRN